MLTNKTVLVNRVQKRENKGVKIILVVKLLNISKLKGFKGFIRNWHASFSALTLLVRHGVLIPCL